MRERETLRYNLTICRRDLLKPPPLHFFIRRKRFQRIDVKVMMFIKHLQSGKCIVYAFSGAFYDAKLEDAADQRIA